MFASQDLPRAWVLLCAAAAIALSIVASARTAHACGGVGERACCVFERVPSCDEGLIEEPGCSGNCGPLSCSIGTCQRPPSTACGGVGERACCAFERIPSCDDGLVEDPGCSGDCGFLSCSLGTCRAPECGGEGQRGCCVGVERLALGQAGPCEDGLIAIAGCSGDCACLGTVDLGASDTCARPSPCGGEGQRSCCWPAGELADGGTACDAGLTELPGCSGDCFCGASTTGVVDDDALGTSSGTCVRLTEIDEPEPGVQPEPRDTCDLRGFADLHMHLFADIGHGGGIVAGMPCPPEDPAAPFCPESFTTPGPLSPGDCAASYCDPSGTIHDALADCYGTDRDLVAKDGSDLSDLTDLLPPFCPDHLGDCGQRLFHGDHTLLDDAVGSDLGTLDGARANSGPPAFHGWPLWSSTTHQQAYVAWLERAWRGGLRLIVQMAVTNTALCRTNKRIADVDCDDSMAFVDQQLQAAYDFQRFVDARSGGPGQGWFRIVRTPRQARQVMGEGKLAVVLGIEVDHLFNCTFPSDACSKEDNQLTGCDFSDNPTTCRDPNDPDKPAADYIRQQLDHYQQVWGVQHIFPVHNFDNAFGGAATWMSSVEVGNRFVEGHWFSTQPDCADQGYSFRLGEDGEIIQFIAGLFGFSVADLTVPSRDERASCNTFGLLPLGRTLVREMMQRGMIIDIDHMSSRAIEHTLDLAAEFGPDGYPLMASHALFLERHTSDNRHERMRTEAQLERMDAMQGMVAVMLKDDVLDTTKRGERKTTDYAPSGVADTCRHSSMTFAQAYTYALDKMGGRVGMGSDFNGIAGHFGPRFGDDACGGNPNERSAQLRDHAKLEYPFSLDGFGTLERHVSGQRTYDYNVHGLAHVGLLPDMIGDLKTLGVTDQALEPLMRSGEAYLQLWERARGETPEQGCIDCADTDTTCDGIDDDCDGLIDEDFAETPTTCGQGRCAETGALSCADGVVVDSCVPSGTGDACDPAACDPPCPAGSTCDDGVCTAPDTDAGDDTDTGGGADADSTDADRADTSKDTQADDAEPNTDTATTDDAASDTSATPDANTPPLDAASDASAHDVAPDLPHDQQPLPTGAPTATTAADDGCGCRIAPSPRDPAPLGAAAALAWVAICAAAARRRRALNARA